MKKSAHTKLASCASCTKTLLKVEAALTQARKAASRRMPVWRYNLGIGVWADSHQILESERAQELHEVEAHGLHARTNREGREWLRA